jgi:glycosyltransferase involved in cell wall biosynthesis
VGSAVEIHDAQASGARMNINPAPARTSRLSSMPTKAIGRETSAIHIRSLDFIMPSVSVVIPTLNEARNLPSLLPRIPHWVLEIIIVDGCSRDQTVEVARRLRRDVRIVMERRRGKGVALESGFAAARGDIIVMLDADGSMAPEEIISFVGALMSGADFAKGSRFLQGAGTDDMSPFRMLGNWALTKAVCVLYGGCFSDLCYGYIAFWRRHLPVLRCDCPGFEIETLLNIRAMKQRLKVVEVASFEALRISGTSNLRAIPDGWRILKTIIRECFMHRVRIVAHGCP